MLYFIGGVSRSGKSKLARRLLTERRLPNLSTDVLVMGLERGAPSLDVCSSDPDLVTGERLWPILRGMSVNMLEESVDYVIEGAALIPEYVAAFARDRHPRVRACFIGYGGADPQSKLGQIRRLGGESNDWVRRHADGYVLALVEKMIDRSRLLEGECIRLGLRYFDTSHDFAGELDAAFAYLTAGAIEPIAAN